MSDFYLPQKKCKRCGYVWIPRKSKIKRCPGCKSPYWNIDRRVKSKGE